MTRSAIAARSAAGSPWGGAREEGLLFFGLMTSLIAVAVWRPAGHVESAMWMAILAMQAIPYAAALACVALSRRADRRPRPAPSRVRARPTPALPALPGGFPSLPARQPQLVSPTLARIAGGDRPGILVPTVGAATATGTAAAAAAAITLSGPLPNKDWPRRAITGYNLWFYAPRPDPESVRR